MNGPIVRLSPLPYRDSVTKLAAEIARSGATLFANIDQSAAAQDAGLALRPTTLLVFGNPKGGTPLMVATPLLALDLPLKLLIWEEHGVVSVAYTSTRDVADRYAVTGHDQQIGAIDRQLASLVASLDEIDGAGADQR